MARLKDLRESCDGLFRLTYQDKHDSGKGNMPQPVVKAVYPVQERDNQRRMVGAQQPPGRVVLAEQL